MKHDGKADKFSVWQTLGELPVMVTTLGLLDYYKAKKIQLDWPVQLLIFSK